MADFPVIYKPRIELKSDGEEWPQDEVVSLDFVCDEDSFLPRCVIRFADPGYNRLSTFSGMGLGSTITFKIIDEDDSNEYLKQGNEKRYSYSLTPLTMADIVESQQSGSATLELLLEHPWKMFKDFTSHAYSGKANSEIIKDLIKNASSRGFKFEDIDNQLFLSSDESGQIPRYKCSEPDLDFIVNKLLPYTTINKTPAIFFVDEKNNVHLSSFNDMYRKESKMMIVIGSEADVTSENYNDASSMNGITLGNNLKIEIGDSDPAKMIEIMKTNVTFDDCSSLFSYTGTLLPKVAVGKFSAAESQSGYVPITLKSMATMSATDKKFYRNHMIDDLKAVALNSQNKFNSFFTIEISSTFCGNMITTGDNVQLVVPPDTTKDKALNDWMNGKWHVKSVRYEFNRDARTYVNKLKLIRPSFMFNKNNTTLNNYDLLYSVGMGIY